MRLIIAGFQSELPKAWRYLKGDRTSFSQFVFSIQTFWLSYITALCANIPISIAIYTLADIGAPFEQITGEAEKAQLDLVAIIVSTVTLFAIDVLLTLAIIALAAKLFSRPKAVIPSIVVLNWVGIIFGIAHLCLMILTIALDDPRIYSFGIMVIVGYYLFTVYHVITDAFQLGKGEHLGIFFAMFLGQLLVMTIGSQV